jgi:hypothetical protein
MMTSIFQPDLACLSAIYWFLGAFHEKRPATSDGDLLTHPLKSTVQEMKLATPTAEVASFVS